jgi:hypothetical protein
VSKETDIYGKNFSRKATGNNVGWKEPIDILDKFEPVPLEIEPKSILRTQKTSTIPDSSHIQLGTFCSVDDSAGYSKQSLAFSSGIEPKTSASELMGEEKVPDPATLEDFVTPMPLPLSKFEENNCPNAYGQDSTPKLNQLPYKYSLEDTTTKSKRKKSKSKSKVQRQGENFTKAVENNLAIGPFYKIKSLRPKPSIQDSNWMRNLLSESLKLTFCIESFDFTRFDALTATLDKILNLKEKLIDKLVNIEKFMSNARKSLLHAILRLNQDKQTYCHKKLECLNFLLHKLAYEDPPP